MVSYPSLTLQTHSKSCSHGHLSTTDRFSDCLQTFEVFSQASRP